MNSDSSSIPDILKPFVVSAEEKISLPILLPFPNDMPPGTSSGPPRASPPSQACALSPPQQAPPPPQNCSPPPPEVYHLQQVLAHGQATREGRWIPAEMELDNITSAVYFGDITFFNGRFHQCSRVGKKATQDGHIVVFGGTGSGKTTCLVISTIRDTWKGRFFTVDFKGDITAWAQEKDPIVLYLHDGKRNKYYYDPYSRLRGGGTANLISNAQALASAIIPVAADSKEPFWAESAQGVLAGAIVYFFRRGKSFIDTMTAIRSKPLRRIFDWIKEDSIATMCTNPDIIEGDRMAAAISTTLQNQIGVFATNPLIRDALSPSRNKDKIPLCWEDLERKDIILRIDQSSADGWGCVMRLMLVQLIRTLQNRPDKSSVKSENIPPVLLLLDEFPLYGKIEIISEAMRLLRSKNVTITLICQSLADLDAVYGSATRRVLLDNCPYQAILSAYDQDTQAYFSRRVGTVSAAGISYNRSYDLQGNRLNGYGTSVSSSTEPAIFPHEFGMLKDDLILIHPGGFSRIQKNTKYQKSPPVFQEEDNIDDASRKEELMVPMDEIGNNGTKMDEQSHQSRVKARKEKVSQQREEQRRNYMIGELFSRYFPEVATIDPSLEDDESEQAFQMLEAFLRALSNEFDMLQELHSKTAEIISQESLDSFSDDNS